MEANHKTIAERILELAISGNLQVREADSREPEIWVARDGRTPRRITVRRMAETKRRQPRLMLELWIDGGNRTICYPRLVWMLHHQEMIPAKHEIHHLDEDYENNAAVNLVCLHPKDHYKFHHKYADEVF